MKTLLFIFILCLVSINCLAQGFSIESSVKDENWTHLIENEDESVALCGFFEDQVYLDSLMPTIKVYSKTGILIRERQFPETGVNMLFELTYNDSGYVVFGGTRDRQNHVRRLYRLHFSYDLTSYQRYDLGDTSRTSAFSCIKKARNNRDWLIAVFSARINAPQFLNTTVYRLSHDFNQVIKSRKLIYHPDSTKNISVYDILELPNEGGYTLLLNGDAAGFTSNNSNYYALQYLDTNMNGNTIVRTEAFPNQSSPWRSGILSGMNKGGIALESDSVLRLYGYGRVYDPGGLNNLCFTDTCARQIIARWKIPSLTHLSTTVSSWTGKPAYYEGVHRLQNYRHIAWGSLERNDMLPTISMNYPTIIMVDEFDGAQRISRSTFSKTGYWFRPTMVKKARKGGYLILSRFNSFLVNGNQANQPMLTRVDSAGQFMVFSENLVEVPLKVWPNPVHGRILRMELPEGPPCQITLLDVQGRSRWVGTRSAQDSQLDLSDTPSGIYFLRITQPGQPPQVTKVVLP